MDIGYRRYVTEYIDFIENIANVIDVCLYNNMETSIEELIKQVSQYVHENFPAILLSKDELIDKVKSIYIQKTENLKKDVDFRKASIKYDLNGTFSLPKIKEYMEKGNKDLKICFRSVSFGTNVSYKDTVLNISSDIFGTIQRKSNNNLIFAKKTKETQEYIEKIVLENYKQFMNKYGEELIKKGINPLEIILEYINNYEEISNKDIIEEYKHTIAS